MQERRLTAIMFTDIVGCTVIMILYEDKTFKTLEHQIENPVTILIHFFKKRLL